MEVVMELATVAPPPCSVSLECKDVIPIHPRRMQVSTPYSSNDRGYHKQFVQHHHTRAVSIIRRPPFEDVVYSFRASKDEEPIAKYLEVYYIA
jgi:hypothetical protein